MEKTERKTKVSNYILKNLFMNYSDVQVKFFMMVVNKAVTAHYAKTSEDNRDDVYNYESENVVVSMDFIKRYKGKKHMTISEIYETMESLHIVLRLIDENGYASTLSAIEQIIYEEDRQQFRIILTEKALEYLILVSENYSCLDLEVLKELRGKYEIGLYVIYCMYKGLKQKRKNYTVEELKQFLNVVGGATKDTIKYVDKAKEKLQTKNIKIDYELTKRGNKIKDIIFTF